MYVPGKETAVATMSLKGYQRQTVEPMIVLENTVVVSGGVWSGSEMDGSSVSRSGRGRSVGLRKKLTCS